MAGTQVRVLYTFEAQPGSGEITVSEGEILTVLRQDVGEGWWEGRNSAGKTGLFPGAYVEEITSVPPPMPPPPLPSTYSNTDFAIDNNVSTNTSAVTTSNASVHDVITKRHSNLMDDDWDDDWDDDEFEPRHSYANGGGSSGFAHPQQSIKSVDSISEVSTSGKDGKGPTRKGFNRFSVLAKSDLEDYMKGLGRIMVDDRDKIFVEDSSQGPIWSPNGLSFTCSITSPKKESKFHGIKSFIAYTITPSTTNQPVSRRYKHFDWLHERLSLKFTMIPIPSLPEKQISGRFEDDLIEYRMTMLQSWIDRICRHPVLSQCEVLRHFLTSLNDEKTWKAGKRKAESDKLVGINFYQAIQRPEVALDLAYNENKLDGYQRFFNQLDEASKLVQNTCVDQTRKYQVTFKREYTKISHCFSKLSRAFDMDPNNCAPLLTDAIRHVSDAYQDIGSLFEEEPKHDWEPLCNLMFEYKGLIDGFPSIISAAKSSIGKRKQLEKDTQEGKADHDQLPPTIHRSDTIVYGLHAEVANFHMEREHDFKKAMVHFITEQTNFYQKIADTLRDKLQHFQSI